ncbi:hypothetical protein ACLKA6_005593, partial [Drosophila palustris]
SLRVTDKPYDIVRGVISEVESLYSFGNCILK